MAQDTQSGRAPDDQNLDNAAGVRERVNVLRERVHELSETLDRVQKNLEEAAEGK